MCYIRYLSCCVLLVCASFLIGCSDFKAIECPPKVLVLKNFDNAYPAFANNYDLSLKATINTADSLSLTGNIGLKRTVENLREKLNQETIRFQDLLKSAYIGYVGEICRPNSELRERYWDLLGEMNQKTSELDALRLRLASLKSSSNTGASAEAEDVLEEFMEEYFLQAN